MVNHLTPNPVEVVVMPDERAPVLPVIAEPWAKARRYVDLTSLHLAASCAAQVLAGMELLELHKLYRVRRGPKSGNSYHDVRNWAEAVKAELGVSEMTAWRWMEMGKVARKRLEKDGTDLAALLDQPPSALTESEREALKRAVHKITDGQTQSELMLEWGITKKPQGSGAKGGDTTGREGAATDQAPPLPTGWHEISKLLNDLLIEHLDPVNRYWNQCDEAQRRELHGNLVDACAAVAATLKRREIES